MLRRSIGLVALLATTILSGCVSGKDIQHLLHKRDFTVNAEWHRDFNNLKDAYPSADFKIYACVIHKGARLLFIGGRKSAHCTYTLRMAKVKRRYATLADVWRRGKGKQRSPKMTALSHFRALYSEKHKIQCNRISYHNAQGVYYTNCYGGRWTDLAAIRRSKEQARKDKEWARKKKEFFDAIASGIKYLIVAFGLAYFAFLLAKPLSSFIGWIAFSIYWTWINRPYRPAQRLRRAVESGESIDFEKLLDGLGLETRLASMSTNRRNKHDFSGVRCCKHAPPRHLKIGSARP